MAGIYIHIPFCRQKCHYCNFHFSVSHKNKDPLVESIIREIELSKGYLETDILDTLYFGGGTPSLLSADELGRIIQKLRENYRFSEDIECTLEANPDDLNVSFLKELRAVGINRLSMGVQSFIDSELTLMNRAHTSVQAKQSLEDVMKTGFTDITIDLIFGMPGSTLESWKSNLDHALQYDIPHFSLYNLTVEKRTALHHFIESGQIKSIADGLMAEQFMMTMDYLTKAGYEHYEISNYARPGRYARHNTSYWQGTSYLGIGPSAHSYNGHSRRWNIANNSKYIKSIQSDIIPFEEEKLSIEDQYNEYILTGLRTQWGCDLNRISAFGPAFENYFKQLVAKELKDQRIQCQGNIFTLTRAGKLFADEVSSGLFYS